MAKSNFSISIAIRPEANVKIDGLVKNLGMSKVELLSRVVGWFVDQPEETQQAILGTIPKALMGDALGLMLIKMAREGLVGTEMSAEEMNEIEKGVEGVLDSVQRATISREVARLSEAGKKHVDRLKPHKS